ncbi:suppressor of fused domain protein [Williamsia sp.]|uniref:suppressor of fused domain protein n=1 Tax=Williamsia sp. TaxID=1872085 RepID=UPI001A239ABB|nr:suppressor of fused domain protein [Williamsia sp.]MBJ7290325.1 suppressor of fused domain protein [Williamsia sp.]
MSEHVTDQITGHLQTVLSGSPQKASVTFLGVEPVDVLRFETDAQVVYVSVGCARHPMTDPTDLAADPLHGPRAEIVIRMAQKRELPGLHRSLALLAAAPSVEGIVLVPDALIDLGEPLWSGSSCTAVVLEPDAIDDCPLPEPMSAVTFLRAVPVTGNEAAWVRLRGVDALRRAWDEAGIDVADPDRIAADPGAAPA